MRLFLIFHSCIWCLGLDGNFIFLVEYSAPEKVLHTSWTLSFKSSSIPDGLKAIKEFWFFCHLQLWVLCSFLYHMHLKFLHLPSMITHVSPHACSRSDVVLFFYLCFLEDLICFGICKFCQRITFQFVV